MRRVSSRKACLAFRHESGGYQPGKELYSVRHAKGRFKDSQTYERAHRAHFKRGT